MNLQQAIAYAKMLDCKVLTATFESGESVLIRHPSGDWRHENVLWGEESGPPVRRIVRWLNGLPWPSEDDPRVGQEGAYAP